MPLIRRDLRAHADTLAGTPSHERRVARIRGDVALAS
jgi:hypothetical protein